MKFFEDLSVTVITATGPHEKLELFLTSTLRAVVNDAVGLSVKAQFGLIVHDMVDGIRTCELHGDFTEFFIATAQGFANLHGLTDFHAKRPRVALSPIPLNHEATWEGWKKCNGCNSYLWSDEELCFECRTKASGPRL